MSDAAAIKAADRKLAVVVRAADIDELNEKLSKMLLEMQDSGYTVEDIKFDMAEAGFGAPIITHRRSKRSAFTVS